MSNPSLIHEIASSEDRGEPRESLSSPTSQAQAPNLLQHHVSTNNQELQQTSSKQDLQRSTTTDMSNVPNDELAALSLNEPYACTFLCGETFPTAQEWRQHELRNHRQQEMWRCDTNIDDVSTGCGATFYSPANFETHLSAAHNIDDYDLEHGHIHPEGQHNFWCGFCRQIALLSTRGVDAWKERLDHLQVHFDNGDSLERGWLKLRE